MSVEDLHERAVDQLVDEALARHHDLRHLFATQQLAGWAGADVRTAAAHVIAILTTGPGRQWTAKAVVTSLWHTDDPTRVPATWWTTPLGGLVLDGMRAAGATHQPQPRATHALRDALAQPVTAGTIESVGDVFDLTDMLTSRERALQIRGA